MSADVIKLLPDSVANQIAAGEVIQRPASVIKELVENAIDAGASAVQIVLKDAGKTLIQVVDNGCGMSTTDARLAFERHATSKIRKAEDLFSLHTMGFRGEALPSIVAVSEVEMRTMRTDDTIGTKLVIKASEVRSQEPCVCARGTNIIVKNLFFNFVARRRFLKKDAQEMSHIMHEFERLALVNTGVEFSLTHNGQLVYQMLASPLKKRIGALFGRSVEQNIIPVETTGGVVRISGYIGLPEAARRRGALQYFFVNGRNMRHPYFHRAVLNCYKDLISADVQPNYFINFEVEPDRIDVNIHPQKHEIKFEDEQLIFQILTAAIRESLGKFNVGPSIDFEASDVPDIPPCVNGAEAPAQPVSDDFDPSYSPFDDFMTKPVDNPQQSHLDLSTSGLSGTHFDRPSSLNGRRGSSSAVNQDWQKLYDTFLGRKVPDSEQSPDGDSVGQSGPMPDCFSRTGAKGSDALSLDNDKEGGELADLGQIAERDGFSTKMIQCKGRYIVTDSKSGLMIIDQHRAHLLVLFHSLMTKLDAGQMTSQYLLIPEDIELEPALSAVVADNLDRFMSIGFQVAVNDSQASEPDVPAACLWQLRAIPTALAPSTAVETFRTIIADIAEQTESPSDKQIWHRRVALSLARATAIRGTTHISTEEIEHLVSELFRLPNPAYTPDGLPVIRIMSIEDIARLFMR